MINFKWRHFQKALILLAIRWYLAYSLSYRDIEELMLERGVKVDHSTINRWVIKYAPLLEEAFRKSHKKSVNDSWRMDETYIKVKGVWHYLYRAVDKFGNTIDFMLSEKRDKPAAKAFSVSSNFLLYQMGHPSHHLIQKEGTSFNAFGAWHVLRPLRRRASRSSQLPQMTPRPFVGLVFFLFHRLGFCRKKLSNRVK